MLSALKYSLGLSLLILMMSLLSSCGPDTPEENSVDLTEISYDPVPYEVAVPEDYPPLEIPVDNPLTEAGVELGRHLFYDPIMSVDSTTSCASCHLQNLGFTDAMAISRGVDGRQGKRSSMSLVDVAFFRTGLFWDGRVGELEDQALEPVEDAVELAHQWPNLEAQLRKHVSYPAMFRRAFGIETTGEITRDLAVRAIAQFERTIVTQGSSKYDRVLANRDVFYDTDEMGNEQLGFEIFFDTVPDVPDGQCFHCHGGPLLTDNEFRNNGLDEVTSLDDFEDLGLGGVTGMKNKNGLFRTPSLRNIALTAPYMHDGRFATLEEVMDHYISGGHPSPNKDPLMDSIFLDNKEKAAVIAFLKTLTDESLLTDDRYSNPH